MSSAPEAPFRLWAEWQLSADLIAALRMAEAKAQVMANAQDLVEEKYILKQFVNVKGD